VVTTRDVPEGERLAKVEASVESLIREMSEVRASVRDLRSTAERNFLWTLGVIIPMWVSLIVAIIIAILID